MSTFNGSVQGKKCLWVLFHCLFGGWEYQYTGHSEFWLLIYGLPWLNVFIFRKSRIGINIWYIQNSEYIYMEISSTEIKVTANSFLVKKI